MGYRISTDINWGLMVKGGTVVVTHRYIGTESNKISTFDLQQIKIFESSSFSNRQHHCPTLPCENGEQGTMLLKLRILTGKKHRHIKLQHLTKTTNMVIWVVATSNQLFIRSS